MRPKMKEIHELEYRSGRGFTSFRDLGNHVDLEKERRENEARQAEIDRIETAKTTALEAIPGYATF